MTSRISVGLICPGWPPPRYANGIVTYVAAVAPSLARLADVTVVPLDGDPDGAANVIDPRGATRRSLADRVVNAVWWRAHPRSAVRHFAELDAIRVGRAATRARPFDVFEMEESSGWARAVQRATGVPVVVRLHGPFFLTGAASAAQDPEEFRWRVEAEGKAIAEADAVCAPSADVLRRVREHYGLELPDAEVIPNPVAPAPPGERWSLDACDRRRILFVGRFDHVKGGDLVVDAFARVLAEVPDARLAFVGPDFGVPEPGGRVRQLEEYVRERLPGALEDGRIELLGRLPPSALPALRRGALLTLIASRYEVFSYTAGEAMALGCPVVAADIGGISALVQDGVNGLLHRPEDVADLAAKAVALLRAPERAAALGRQAAADVERTLHPDVVAPRLVRLYERAAARRRTRR